MSGRAVTAYWRICWSVVTPVLMIIIFVYSAFSIKPLTYSRQDYPGEYIGKIKWHPSDFEENGIC